MPQRQPSPGRSANRGRARPDRRGGPFGARPAMTAPVAPPRSSLPSGRGRAGFGRVRRPALVMVGAALVIGILATTETAVRPHHGPPRCPGRGVRLSGVGDGTLDPRLPDTLGGAGPALRPQVPGRCRYCSRRSTRGVGRGLPLPVQRVRIRSVGVEFVGPVGNTHLLHPVASSGQRASGGGRRGVDLSMPVVVGTETSPTAAPYTIDLTTQATSAVPILPGSTRSGCS